MRLIDADALNDVMYHEAFENDESYDERNPMARWDSGLWIRYKMFENAIADAPSINIEPKRGEWICHEGRWIDFDYYPTKYECNQCHHYVDVASDKNFCPNCGADMRKRKESE